MKKKMFLIILLIAEVLGYFSADIDIRKFSSILRLNERYRRILHIAKPVGIGLISTRAALVGTFCVGIYT